jgi:MraZ protein
MPSTEANSVIRYKGTFFHGVDDQRRVQVPAKWRPSNQDMEFTVIEWPKHQAGVCLLVMPPHEVEKRMAEIDAMPSDDPDKGRLRWLIASESESVSLDKSGRLCLPDRMMQSAGISKEAVLVGVWNRFEVWNPERHKAAKTEHSVLAPEVLKRME